MLLVPNLTDVAPRLPTATVRVLRPEELDAPFLASWNALESRALAPNAFLSPNFVLPAVRHLTPHADVRIAAIEMFGTLCGLGVFELRGPTRALPVRHLASYECIHSYAGSVLIDRECASTTLNALFRFLIQPGADWHAVQISKFPGDGPFFHSWNQHAPGLKWHESARVERSILRPSAIDETYLRTHLQSRSKDCARLLRNLSKQGEVTWKYIPANEISDANVERFLELEHMGWKAEGGTSLLSSASNANFFREMISTFCQRGQAFLTELHVNGEAIASIVNLTSGDAGFTFKVAWHADFARYAPGILNEFEFMRHAAEHCSALDYIDSGAEPGSYIDGLWRDRRTLISGVYPTSALGEKAVRTVSMFKRFIGKP